MSNPAAPRILAGDIGGTKSLFGVFEGTRCIQQRRIANADFSNFSDVLACALGEFDLSGLKAACLALAGPIADDGRSAKITNLPWRVEAATLEKQFGLPRITLVNDFAAAALGAVTSKPEQRVTLQAGAPLASAPQLVVGAGTGLGMALVLPEPHGWRIVPGEGGHVGFAPADAEQIALWQALQEKFGRVTWERIVSGPGLEFVYHFICTRDRTPADLPVTALATAPAESSAGRAIALFLRCYGAYAGDMAMTVLPRGGVHLAGGIAAQLLPQLASGSFLDAFNNKAEHAGLASRMPVHVCTDPALGINGAAHFARLEY